MRPKRAIATVCLSGTLPDKLEAAAAAGFDAVEIFENDLLTYEGTAAEAGRMCSDLGLEVALFQPFRDFESMPEPQRRPQPRPRRAQVRHHGAARRPHGAGVLQRPGRGAAGARTRRRRPARNGRARRRAAALLVGYEALAWGTHVNRWRQAWDIVRRADHPALGLILDSFHTLCLGDDLAGSPKPCRRRSCSSSSSPTRRACPWTRSPGAGISAASPARASCPSRNSCATCSPPATRGPLSLEIFNDEFRSAPARRIARDGLRGLVWAEEGAGVAALPAPPGALRHRVRRIRRGRRRRADELGAFLGTLGFRLAGRHRSKAVTLHRNGDVNLVLNAEPDSAASERFEQHGPCVCAMAFRVDDPARALARAEAHAPPHLARAHGRGRAPHPRDPRARRHAWSTWCKAGSEPRRARSGRTTSTWNRATRPRRAGRFGGVDHVAQALTPDMMDSFSLFYRAVFGLEPDAPWELPDPYGLVRSRAFTGGKRQRAPAAQHLGKRAHRHRPLRLRLCRRRCPPHRLLHGGRGGSDRGGGRQGRTAARHPGELLRGPRRTPRSRRRRVGRPAPPPPALRPRARRRGGTFRHAYTHPFQDRFFLEIAERKGGYDGFGAVNAGVRMAAQGRPQRR